MHRTRIWSQCKPLIYRSTVNVSFNSVAVRYHHFNLLNLKIGFTNTVENHPDSDKLFVSQIKLDQANGTKQICSGLRDHLSRESLQHSLVVVVDNMKKCKLRGQVSEGMILCGENVLENKVSLCTVDSFDTELIGKSVVLKSAGAPTGEPTTRRIKTKEWEDISSRLKVGDHGRITYRDEDGIEETYLCVYSSEGEPIPVIAKGLPTGSAVK